MRDQDGGDCGLIKENLRQKCIDARHEHVLIRIACRELESFYLGDLNAVQKGLEIRRFHGLKSKSEIGNPDQISQPSELLIKITNNQYQKIGGSRAIAPHLAIDGSNSSHSFHVLIKGICGMIR